MYFEWLLPCTLHTDRCASVVAQDALQDSIRMANVESGMGGMMPSPPAAAGRSRPLPGRGGVGV